MKNRMKAWSYDANDFFYEDDMYGTDDYLDLFSYLKQGQKIEIIRSTGMRDMDGVEIYEGDLVNVFYKSFDGEFDHDLIFLVECDHVYGLSLKFVGLLWESFGYNQYPIYTDLKMGSGIRSNRAEDVEFMNIDIVPYDGSRIESSYIKVIGNKFQNPELM